MKIRINASLLSLITICLFISCKTEVQKVTESSEVSSKHTFKFSLGQWTYHKDLFSGKMSTFDFIDKTKILGFDGVDFVNQFFIDKAHDNNFLDSLKFSLNKNSLEPVMIMVDREGDLGNLDSDKRKEAVKNHLQWVDAAKYLGCKFIRVNAFGDGDQEKVFEACYQSISSLADYAAEKGIQILIENHGGYSSDGDWLVNLANKLKEKQVGLLPDFDNWCIERENGERWNTPCIKEYDRYQGIKQLLPFAQSLSVKSFEFDVNGNEIKTDFKKMFQLIEDMGYKDYIGIEFEGDGMEPTEGVEKTLDLINRILSTN